jgi:hypothetical protein
MPTNDSSGIDEGYVADRQAYGQDVLIQLVPLHLEGNSANSRLIIEKAYLQDGLALEILVTHF